MSQSIRAVLFDFGGVLTTSPFQAFARYEAEAGLPPGFVRGLNAANPDTNAWSRLERSEVTIAEFCRLYEDEARAAGHDIDAAAVLACLRGDLVQEMFIAVLRLREAGLLTALLTNNFVSGEGTLSPAPVGELFDAVVESAREGVRKPELRFYEVACERLGIAAHEAVFLDDLGVNLKPARQLGMVTIKVVDHGVALAELEAVVGMPLR